MNVLTIQSNVFKESLEKLWPIWTEKINTYETILIWWEIIKINIKQLTIEISKSLNTSKYELNKMELRLNEIKDSDKYIHKNECKNLKQKIKQFYEKQTEAAKIRSRVKNFEEGEKSTRYFYNLEKHNISNKTWTKIKCKDGTVKTDIHSILSEQTNFFKELLTSDDIDLIEANSLLNNVDTKLNNEERDFCEKDVSSEEIFKIIKQLKPNKSPGDDGIISEFYKTYWYLIKRELTDVIKYSLENDTLSKTQYNAIITLLYKKGNREDISNWRPISLLNTGVLYHYLTQTIR